MKVRAILKKKKKEKDCRLPRGFAPGTVEWMPLCGSSIAPHAVGREWLSVRDATGHPVSYEARATHCKRGFGKEATMGVLKNNDDPRAGLPHLKTNKQTTTTTKMNMVPQKPFSVFTSPCVI